MLKTLRVALTAMLVCLLMPSCHSMYEEPAGDRATASIEFSPARIVDDEPWHGGTRSTDYDVVTSEACDGRSRIAWPEVGSDPQRRRVTADAPIMLLVTTKFPELLYRAGDSTSGMMGDRQPGKCVALVSFVPRAGRTYTIERSMPNDESATCETTVLDADTKNPPPDLSVRDQFVCRR
jgi:hypothetical protein